MKKTKLVVALAAALLATAGVATTSTFAWFTTTRTATVNVSNIKAYAGSGNLTVAYLADTGHETNITNKANPTTDTVEISGTTGQNDDNVTDVSGNGIAMYKPNWIPGAEGRTVSSFTDVTELAASKYYVSFGLTLTNTGTVSDMKVYLNTKTKLSIATPASTATAHTDANISALAATRVAILNSSKNDVVWSTAGVQDTTYDYVSKETGTAYGTTTYKTGNDFSAAANNFAKPVDTISAVEATEGKYVAGTTDLCASVTTEHAAITETTDANYIGDQLIATLGHTASTNSANIYVRVWLEGTSKYCVNDYDATNNKTGYDARGGVVGLYLDLAAL